MEDHLVQYIIIRRDIAETWPLGPVCAQAAHASVAAISQFIDHPETQQYLKELRTMHKVVLRIKGKIQLTNLQTKLTAASIDHYLWVEEPEHEPVAIATRPALRSRVYPHVRKLQLLK